MTTSIGFDVFARDHASKTFDKIGRNVDETKGKFSKFGAFAGAALAGAGIAFAGFAVSSVKKASDLNETINKSNIIFGKNADQIDTWAKGAAKNLGMSRQSALDAASGFGDMFLQLGFGLDKATDMSKKIVDLSADLGSFNNLPTAEVQADIAAAFRGEYDALQKLIPNINDARVKQVALHETGKKSVDTLTAQEKAHAVLTIVQHDGARAAGDFARTSDSMANQSKIARARFDDLSATFGTKLLPAVTTVLGKALEFTDWLEKNPGKAKALGVALGVLAGAFALATAAALLMNLAFLATPVGAAIAGMVALGAALVIAYKKSETFRNIVNRAFDLVKVAALQMALGAVIAFRHFIGIWLTLVSTVVHGAALAFGWVPGLGPKLKAADRAVSNFKDGVNRSLSKVQKNLEIKLATAAAQANANALKRRMDAIRSRNVRINLMIQASSVDRWAREFAFRQHGGPVRKGRPYIVGERGPELIIPKEDAQVLDNAASSAVMAGKNGRAATVTGAAAGGNVIIYVNGPTIGTPTTIAQQIHQALMNLQRERGTSLGLA